MAFETEIKISVFPDPDYYFEVVASSEEIYISSTADDSISTVIGFGSIEEMESVANAMLTVVKMRKTN